MKRAAGALIAAALLAALAAPVWSALVDGRPAPVLRADLAALGVELLPGKHLVELRYFAPGLWAGLALALATAALLSGLSLRSARRR